MGLLKLEHVIIYTVFKMSELLNSRKLLGIYYALNTCSVHWNTAVLAASSKRDLCSRL